MARVAGIDIPGDKRLEIALTYIHGIGKKTAQLVSDYAKIDKNVKVKDLSDAELGRLKEAIESNFKVEGALRKDTKMNIERLMRIKAYRGVMHRRGLPVRGQRTKTNARTRKGPVKMAVKKKAKPGKK
jgi:small subunit ribosomal protein S13